MNHPAPCPLCVALLQYSNTPILSKEKGGGILHPAPFSLKSLLLAHSVWTDTLAFIFG